MTTGRTTYHHGDLRAALLEETERMIAANELASVTFQELGRRLGVARSAPYRHFESKNALLCAVASEAFRRFKARFRALREQPGQDTATRFRAMCTAYFRFAVDHPDYYRLMFRENLVGANETAELAQAREESFEELVLILGECQETGLLAPGDLETQSLFVWSFLHGMCSLVIDAHIPEPVFAALLDELLTGILRGMS